MSRKINFDWLLFIFSLTAIYFLAPDLDRRHGPLVALSFALILIVNSKMGWHPKIILRYCIFMAIDLLTYFILFNDQPWDVLFHGGLFDSSPAPLIICSLIMSLAGGLILRNWSDRVKYILITSGLQIPIAILAGSSSLESFLNYLSDILGYYHSYYGAWQAWQFEWMLTYFLPMYFLNLKYFNEEK